MFSVMPSVRARQAIATSIAAVVYVLLACAAVVAVWSGISGTVNSWHAQHDGEVGTFTPVEQHCSSNRGTPSCRWTGTWEPEARDRVIKDVLLDESLGTAEGDPPPGPVHPTLHHDALSDPQVVYRPGDRTWLLTPAVTTVFLGGSAYLAWKTHRWSRRAAAAAARRTGPGRHRTAA